MSLIPSAPELPDLNGRDVTTLQFVDASGRIEALLINSLTGLPAGEAGLREMLSDAQAYGVELDGRLGIDRKSKFTSKKTLAHRDRLKYFHALRRGARGIVRDPDPGVLSSKVEAARLVLDVVLRHGADIKKLTRAETSAALRLLLKEFAGDGLQAALQATDLHRYCVLCQQAHERYANLLSEAGLSEAETDSESGETSHSAAAPAKSAPADAPALSLRELKAVIEELLGLVFATMAFHAAKGREPYARLLGQCREITQEINSDAKLRETRARKAEAKKATAQAGTSTATSTGSANGSTTENKAGTERGNVASAPSTAASAPAAEGDGEKVALVG